MDRRTGDVFSKGRMWLGGPAILVASTICALSLTGEISPAVGLLAFVMGAAASMWAWEAP